MPNIEDIHIQKIAPGPPATSAEATPAIFPIPILPASAVLIASNADTDPDLVEGFLQNKEPSVAESHTFIWNKGKKCKWIV